jgi:hypothetical protein
VVNLHADYLDGYSETSFARTIGQTGVLVAEGEWADVDEDGTDESLMAIADCPAGTKMTGGGVDNFTGEVTYVDSPGPGGTWWAAALADPSINEVTELSAYVVCYNPRGAVPGALAWGAGSPTRAMEDRLQQRLAAALTRR